VGSEIYEPPLLNLYIHVGVGIDTMGAWARGDGLGTGLSWIPIVLVAAILLTLLTMGIHSQLASSSSDFYIVVPPGCSTALASAGAGVLDVEPESSSIRYRVHEIVVDASGRVIEEREVELDKPPAGMSVSEKKVSLIVREVNGTRMLIPVIKDFNRVKSAVFYVWKYTVEGNSLTIELKGEPLPDAVVDALSNCLVIVEDPGKAFTAALTVEYIDGTRDSVGYTAVGFDVVVKWSTTYSRGWRLEGAPWFKTYFLLATYINSCDHSVPSYIL